MALIKSLVDAGSTDNQGFKVWETFIKFLHKYEQKYHHVLTYHEETENQIQFKKDVKFGLVFIGENDQVVQIFDC